MLQNQLRSQIPTFDFQVHCFYFVSEVKDDRYAQKCQTLSFQKVVLNQCDARKDAWSDEVRGHLSIINDLLAADAVYHVQCCTNFGMNRNLPVIISAEVQEPERPRLGRPEDQDAKNAFSSVCKFLVENDYEQITVSDLVLYMGTLLQHSSSEPYSNKHIKRKLQERYPDEIIFIKINGKSNVVTFKANAKKVMYDYYTANK